MKNNRFNYPVFDLMTIVQISFTIIFLFFIIMRIWFDLKELQTIRPFKLLLPLAFIFIIYYRTKLTWVTAVLLFLYGIYYYFFKWVWIAWPGSFEFTLPLKELLYGDKHGYRTGHPFQIYLNLFPLLFYFTAVILFQLKAIRKYYLVYNVA